MGKFDALKKEVGKSVLKTFEQLVAKNEKVRDEQFQKSMLQHAAKLAEEMPFVTQAFRNNGILTGTHNEIVFVFRPNLWAQDYAHDVGALEKMSVYTAAERGHAAAQHVLETSPGLREYLRKRSRSDQDFMKSMEQAALIEAAYYTRIGGEQLDIDVARRIDIALMRRYIKKESMFQTIMRRIGVDENDPVALFQIAETIDLSGCLHDISKMDPYFVRRSALIEDYKAIAKMNAEESVKIAALKSEAFTRELLFRALKRKNAEPWLVKAVMDLFKDIAV